MKLCLIFPIFFLLVSVVLSPASAGEAHFDSRIILGRQDAPGAFAIPKLVLTPAGTALIVAQDRQGGDWGKRIDPILMRSTDGGKTWGAPAPLLPPDFPDMDRYHMKPTGIVVDGERNRVFVFISRSPLVNRDGETIQEYWFYSHIQETRALGRAWFLVHSDDDGVTWSAPKEITGQLIKKPHWQEWSPVHSGIQLQTGPNKGRLVVPVRCYCPDADPMPHDPTFQTNGILYSDDHGTTWIPGAKTDANLGECSIVEAPGGVIYMNQRATYGKGRASERWYAVSTDGGKSFTPTASTGYPDVLCHAGLTTATDAAGKPLILMTSIPGNTRRFLIASLSRDAGKTWRSARIIEPGHAAYSDLITLPDGSFLCVYETGADTSRKDLAVARFNLDWVLEETAP